MEKILGIDPEDWHAQSATWGHPFHSMCSYIASFPPKVPHYFIDRFTKPGEIVLDPFSGRGTTPTEACLMNRIGIGNDLNPIAYVLTKAKIRAPNKAALFKRIKRLEEGFEPQDTSTVPDDIRMLYNEITQQQLLYLRQELDIKRSDIDNHIMALVLGGMHGNSTRPSFMSIPMPNTFSMSPKYVRKYIAEHKLTPPNHDAFTVIKFRMNRYHSEGIPSVRGRAFNVDVRDLPAKLRGAKADLIFTSPPYLNVIKYGKLNWIRLWMLGIEPKGLDKVLDDKHTMTKYVVFLEDTLKTCEKMVKDDGLCFIVVGQVGGNSAPGKDGSVELGSKILSELDKKTDLEFMGLVNDYYNKDAKVSRIWGKEKMGRATKYDQILVLSKDPKAVDRKRYKKKVDWGLAPLSTYQTTLQR